MQLNFKKGFTLSEVLITLAIIGVVVAFTLPTIIKYFDDVQNLTAWKKAYSNLEQLSSRIREDNGGSLNGVFTSSSVARDVLGTYLSYIKTCDGAAMLGTCWYSGYAKRFDNGQFWTCGSNGNEVTWWQASSAYAAILKDGMAIYFQEANPNCNESSECLRIFIDTNGPKGPNTMGKDIFYVWFYSNKISLLWNYYGTDGGGMGAWLLSH